MWSRALCLIVLVLTGTASRAQDESRLRGLRNVDLIIERLDGNSKACEIDEPTIKNSVLYPLANSRLKTGGGSTAPALYVQVTTVYLKDIGLCATNVDMQVWTSQPVFVESTQNATIAKVLLWDENYLFTSGQKQHRGRVRSTLEEMAKKLVVDWSAAQR